MNMMDQGTRYKRALALCWLELVARALHKTINIRHCKILVF
jgi:hypothetical protein